MDPSLLACAPQIAPSTLEAVIRVESGGRPLAININRGPRPAPAATPGAAAAIVRAAIEQGYSVDMGLMQVNSRNLPRLGYTIEQMFDPCVNIRAGSIILSSNYLSATKIHGEGPKALLAALSAYNTGNFQRGFTNGYISRYFNSGHATLIIGEMKGVKIPQKPSPFYSNTSVFQRAEISHVRIDNP
jgi:type IV secretion system protein VirB1